MAITKISSLCVYTIKRGLIKLLERCHLDLRYTIQFSTFIFLASYVKI